MNAILLAKWLSRHTSAIACDEAAGELYRDVKDAVDHIERVVNRPAPDRFLGPCPVVLTESYGERVCSTELTAGRDDTSVQCSGCKQTHEVNELHEKQFERTDEMSFTIAQLFRIILPINREYVPLRTLQHWAASGRLVPTGYDGEDPRFLLADVRELRVTSGRKAGSGAAMHKGRKAC